jgi:hypothetical protein
MQWNEYLAKIEQLRKDGGKAGFNVGLVIRLIYVGAFQSMIAHDPGYTTMPAWRRCLRMAEEVTKAFGSKAALAKKSKTEPVGIIDINSDAALVLWRHLVNPLFTFNLTGLYGKTLTEGFGFVKNQVGNTATVPYCKETPGKSLQGIDLYSAWEYVFRAAESYGAYTSWRRAPGVIGVVTSTQARSFQSFGKTKTFLAVTFFDGFKTHECVLWPDDKQFHYNEAKAAVLAPCSYGIFLIQPKVIKGRLGGSLKTFYPIRL